MNNTRKKEIKSAAKKRMSEEVRKFLSRNGRLGGLATKARNQALQKKSI